jgi:hypothetical protein
MFKVQVLNSTIYEMGCKMKTITIVVSLLVAITSVGCRSSTGIESVSITPPWSPGPAELVSYGQICSRHWIDDQGRVLEFICTSNLMFKGLSKLLVAQYGDTNAGIVTCLDFYRPADLPGLHSEFIQLVHDVKPAKMMVTSVNAAEFENGMAIMITRETIPDGMNQRKGLQYVWRYDENLRMSLDVESRTWPILEK